MNIRTKRIFIISNLLFLFGGTASSQNYQLAGVSYVLYPNSSLKDEDKSASFTFQEFGGFIRMPYKFKNEKTAMVNSISYAYIKSVVDNTSVNFDGKDSEKMQVLSFQTIIAQKLKNNFRIVFSLRPTLASDFKEKLSSNDFVMQGFLFLAKKKNEHLSFGLGLANTMRLGDVFLLPIIPFNLKKNKHDINAIFPIKFDYVFCVDNKEKLKIGIRETANGGNINIKASYSDDNIVTEIDKVSYSRVNIGPVIYYNINKYIQFEALGGISLRRRYNLSDKDNNKYEFYLKNAPFYQMGIFLTPPKPK